MKFDFAIGNPPYQEEQVSTDTENSLKNYAPPVYDKFLDSASEIADKVEMIHPARFLFNAGSTPKSWNEKMLQDEHFKVLAYEPASSNVFPGLTTPLKGGVAITYRDSERKFGSIVVFSQYPQANSISHKVITRKGFKSFMDIVYSRTVYRLTDKMHHDYPNAINQVSSGHAYDMSSNIFERIPEIFHDNFVKDGNDYIRILGRDNGVRAYKYIRRDYVNKVDNLDFYKVFIPQANGNGYFGETVSMPLIAEPGVGHTETFISIGKFKKKKDALATVKYIKTKFARMLLSLLKVTQNGNKPVWRMIPLQNFTDKSDIDWSKSVAEIDQQLYKKYGLTIAEINFIESKVKEME